MIPAQIHDKVEEINKIKHLKEPSMLIGVFDGPNAASKIIVGYDSRHGSNRVQLHSYIRLGTHAFVQSAPSALLGRDSIGVINKTGYKRWVAEMQDTARRLRVREENDIPTEPGLCIEDGFVVDGAVPDAEMTSIGFRFPEYPDVSFSIRTIKTDRPDDTNSLEWSLRGGREDAERAGKGALYAKIKTLRKSARRMGDWDGAEILNRMPVQKDVSPSVHQFLFNAVGVANDGLRPIVDVQLDTGVSKNSQGVNEPSLQDAEAVALWDKLTKTIRGRPTGAAAGSPKPKADKPTPARSHSSAPLGTTLASGSRCPQAGTWTCAETAALGGARRAFTAGETLPSVLVPVERTLLQRLKGEAQNRHIETVWTLRGVSEASEGT